MRYWRIGDLIDLEYFFLADDVRADNADERPAGFRTRRDRDLFLHRISPELPERFREPSEATSPVGRRRIIRQWIDLRRAAGTSSGSTKAPCYTSGSAPGPTPGILYGEIWRLLLALLVIFPLLFGGGMASSLLFYTGREPLNISVYLGVLVLPQLLWLLLLLLYTLVRGASRYGVGGLPHSILARITFRRLMARLQKLTRTEFGLQEHLDGKQRLALDAAAGLWKRLDRIYGSLLHRPFFVLLQWAGVWFNIGILAATLLRVTGTDLAFGWQSTLEIGPEAVHQAVQWISVPWASWAPASLAPPDLDTIQGSRLILKEGIYHLSTEDLTAWWPFLCFSVAFYGLMPRLILLLFGWMDIRFRLSRLPLAHSDCDRLLARMLTPKVETGGHPDDPPQAAERTRRSGSEQKNADAPSIGSGPLPAASGPLAVLLPSDMGRDLSHDMLIPLIRRRFHREPDRILPLGPLPSDTRRSMEELPEILTSSDGVVLIIQEAWQPPIQETLRLLRDLRERVGNNRPVGILLVGKPKTAGADSSETQTDIPYQPVAEAHRKMWRQRLASLGDPWLFIEELERQD